MIIVIRVLDAIPFITFNDFYSPNRLLPQFSLILIYYNFGLYHNKYSDDRTKKDLIYVFLISFIISALISLYHLSHNQYAIRYAIGFAIGDFNLVYTGVCIVSIIVYLMLNKRLNMQLMIILIISVLLVLKANYMTAIALMSVLILLSILLKIRKNYVLFMIIFIALISLLLLKLESVARFILVISELKIFSNAIKIRLIDISNFLSNRNLLNSNTLQTRLELSSIS